MSYNSRHPPNSGKNSGYHRPARDHRGGGRHRDQNPDHRIRGRASSPQRRDSWDSRDNYRPSAGPSHSGRQDYAPRDFRDSRQSIGHSLPPPPPSLPPPPPPPSDDYYRVPQGDFSFRVAKPAGVQQEQDSYRPQNNSNNTRRHADRQGNRSHQPFRNDYSSWARGGRSDRNFRQPWRPFVAAEREILHANHNTGSELAYFDTEGGVTYRNLDELSDSEEAEMDISGDEAGSPAKQSNKRARTSANQSAAGDSAPKWSNPDPYTVLPPETANQKKKDVVQLIRKARVQAKETRHSLPSDTADFISLDFDDSDNENSDDDLVIISETKRTAETVSSSASSLPAGPAGPSGKHQVPSLLPDPTSSALGSRKRTADDRIKMPHAKLKRAAKAPSGGGIVEEWRPVPHLTSTPWLREDHSRAKDPLVWLHKEIVDFYDYIKPRDFEENIREELVQDMKKVARLLARDAVVHPFGSFPSGLYLPTGDMDLVLLSEQFLKHGRPKFDKRNALFKFRNVLTQNKVAWEDDVEVIIGAKVPLVKFIDKRTGLKVDVSFENTTGLTAIKTFLAWKDQYPGMPALVTLIKHFLLMRGLNEPVNGGIGGFSVICLVVSMLQLMPEVQSGALNTRHHLGDLLLHFFDLYGNKFDLENIAIRLNPPGYIPKDRVRSFAYKNYNRLSIIDPNNPENDIAGGSSNAPTVFGLFAQTYRELRQRMKTLAEDPKRAGNSILGTILGGNYTSFQEQRDYLESLSQGHVPSAEEMAQHQAQQSHHAGPQSKNRNAPRWRK